MPASLSLIWFRPPARTAGLIGILLAVACGPGDDRGQPEKAHEPATQTADAEQTAADAPLIRLSHSHAADKSSEIHFAARVFQQELEATGGAAASRVKLFPRGALGSERDVYESLQMGSGATCIISGTAVLSNFTQRIAVLDLPMLWEDYEHVHRVLDGEVGRELAGDLEAIGLVVLAWMDSWGYRNVVTAERPVNSLEDLRGLKLRTIPTPIYTRTIRALGANPTPMSMGEVYTSMQTGVIDGFEHGATVVLSEKMYEVADHIALTRHLFGPLVFCYSKVQWDGLSPERQAAIRAAARRARDEQRRLAPERDAEALAALREKGMTIHEVDMSEFAVEARRIQERVAAEVDAVDLLEKIRALAGNEQITTE